MIQEFFISDLFWTFQGEGANWGRRALFVRMPYCNLKCSWCDTEFNSFTKWSLEEFVKFVKSEDCRFAVLTGGEPMMNKQSHLIIEKLKELGFEIACETNGTFKILDGIDFVTISPKREAAYRVHSESLSECDELKFVVDDEFDFKILDRFINKVPITCRLTLSPEYGNMSNSIQKITEYIKENPQWRLSLQTHKWINIK